MDEQVGRKYSKQAILSFILILVPFVAYTIIFIYDKVGPGPGEYGAAYAFSLIVLILLFIMSPISVILSIIALFLIKKYSLKGMWFAIIALILGLLPLLYVGYSFISYYLGF